MPLGIETPYPPGTLYLSFFITLGLAARPIWIKNLESIPMTASPHAKAYLQFLQLCATVAGSRDTEWLNANHKALLESVALHWSLGQPLSVRGAIKQAHLGSPATLHKRLQRLIAQGYLTAQGLDHDRRTKWVTPTDKGLDYFHWMGKKLISALDQH